MYICYVLFPHGLYSLLDLFNKLTYLLIKFSKTAFLNILKYAIKRACLYVCYHKYTAPMISVSELIVAFSIVNSMQSPDATYRGVEIVVHSLLVAFEIRLNTAT